MFTIGVFAIIFDNKNRVLLCHRRDYDLWNLPGGRLENNEAPWEGVKREVKEETGFVVCVKRMTGIYSKLKKNDIVLQFECKIIGGKMKINNEADKIEYFAFDDIPYNTPSKQIERIKDVLDNPNKFYMKKQISESSKELIKRIIGKIDNVKYKKYGGKIWKN